jgi:ATP-binding cassette subfamily B protein/subfamily B ATP-binding cassette protein MsbA
MLRGGDLGVARLRGSILVEMMRLRGRVVLAALGLVGVIVTELVAPWPLKIVIDYILLAAPLPDHLGWLQGLLDRGAGVALAAVSASIAVIALAAGTFSYLQINQSSRIGHELVHALRVELFGHLQRLSLSFHTRAQSGEMLARVTADTNQIRDVFSDWLLQFVAQALMVAGMLGIMFFMEWRLALGVFGTLPLLFVALLYLNRRIRLTARSQRKEEGRVASRINEMLSSIALVQSFGRESFEEARFAVDSAQSLEAGIESARITASVSKTIALVTALGTAGTVLAGAWLALHKAITPGDLLIFVAYVRALYKPLRDLGKLSAKFSRATASAERIGDILGRDPAIVDRPDAIEAPALRGAIEFDDVVFGYESAKSVLTGVSFHVRAGQTVAIVGASGAGKSTVVSLLLRLFEPASGTIRIDGVEVGRYRRESLRARIGVVLQDNLLFGASIRENIAYGKPNATLEEIEAAARLAQAHGFITALADGYDTVLGERGVTLSGGQRQRICLARALVKRPSILVLDEPTSAVDSLSAAAMDEAVRAAHRGKTLVVIAHRFARMEQFDQILVLRNGRVVEHGAHGALIAAKGHYYELARRFAA